MHRHGSFARACATMRRNRGKELLMATTPKDRRPRWIAWLAQRLGTVAWKLITFVLFALVIAVVARACMSTQGTPLQPWHTLVPDELDATTIERSDWRGYVAAESRMFDVMQRRLQREMAPQDRTPLNRYYAGSLTSPAMFGRDWNRSYVLEPAGAPRGVAVLLHGLTDSPYSMRSLAQLYQAHGYVALVPRMPGHGTVPGGLTREGRKEWNAAVTMAVAEAHRRAGASLPVHLVGYSNGAALALLHVMRRIEHGEPAGVTRLVLLSPMIEVNRFARYAGLAGLPAIFGRYAKSAWLDLLPEYNAFKYNSFPVRAARESYLVTDDVHTALETLSRQQRLGRMPPVVAFQSVVDGPVSARGVMTQLFDRLGPHGSELVLFDVNRNRIIAPMFRDAATGWPGPALQQRRDYALTLVGASSPEDPAAVARTRAAGADTIATQAIGLSYPDDVYSLSHIAMPFAPDDALYGRVPSQRGVLQLGAIAVRGERNTLIVTQDSLSRLSYNPFHAYMLARIEAGIER